eukprot:4734213-Alexandrium_andersonii.AAC.1
MKSQQCSCDWPECANFHWKWPTQQGQRGTPGPLAPTNVFSPARGANRSHETHMPSREASVFDRILRARIRSVQTAALESQRSLSALRVGSDDLDEFELERFHLPLDRRWPRRLQLALQERLARLDATSRPCASSKYFSVICNTSKGACGWLSAFCWASAWAAFSVA